MNDEISVAEKFFMESKEQPFYRKGVLEESKMFYISGQLAIQQFYQNGERNGPYKHWDGNGKLQRRSFYRNGKREGKDVEFHENGNPWIKKFYIDGKIQGECKIWYETGQVKYQEYHLNRSGIDFIYNFGKNRRQTFLKLKRISNFRSKFPIMDELLILDLSRIVSGFM